jgi:hypothetical protein
LKNNFELTKVLFLQNDELEESFKKCFTSLHLKSLRSKLDKEKQLTARVLQRATVENKTEGSKGISGPINSEPSVGEWNQWILRHLDEYVLRISGNEGINLIAGMNHSNNHSLMIQITDFKLRLAWK